MNRALTTLLLALLVLLNACSGNAASTATLPPTIAVSTPTVAVSTPEAPTSRTFTLVPEESQASYTVEEEFFSGAVTRLGKQLGLFTTVGATKQMTGSITLDANSPYSIVGGEFTVNIFSLTSDEKLRDERIQEEFLESRNFPNAVFVPRSMEGPEDYQEGQEVTFQLVGDLTIRDVTNSTTFTVTATLEGDTLSGVATTNILMTDFGFDPPEIVGFMKSENDVLVTLQFVARE